MPPRRAIPPVLLVLLACGAQGPDASVDVPVRVGMVAVDTSNTPVIILEEEDGQRWLPIWIGTAEARSIAAEMEQQRPPRPNTHDLAKQLIQGLNGEVERVVVTELRHGTYYALLFLRTGGGLVELDSRPSDAIAIALRTGAPIFVRATVFEDANGPRPDEPGKPIDWRGHGTRPTGTSPATRPPSI